jgi:hypothetical protein
MTQKLNLFLMLLIVGQSLFAQQNLPIIRAKSKTVDIQDGDDFKKATWTISPDLKPDIYQTQSKKVTFYTDIDSITFKVIPNQKYNFIILLNGKDSAYTQIVYVPGYLDILMRASEYNLDDKREIPVFTYQSSRDSNLVALKKAFNLDSIAGFGNETSKVINLLHWVHNTVRHDGLNESGIKNINAYSIVNTARAMNIGVSCGELATTLNDCYLAMGWASRKIYCFPKDSLRNDHDSHVINVVFLTSKNKWIWVDPTNNAYIMDEKGDLLSIEEVRERLILSKPLIINPDANYRKNPITKEYYLDTYMAKNLYRIYCPLSSEYDYETWGRNKRVTYVYLLPLDYQIKGPYKSDDYFNPDLKTTFNNYYINNPKIFWQKPVNEDN